MKEIIVGFTGTRSGMSAKQKREVLEELENLKPISKILHGGCKGADIDFHNMCEFTFREVLPGHSAKTGECDDAGGYSGANEIHESQTYFKRNRDIVDQCDILIATPYNNNQNGGTWYTINYALANDVEVSIFERI